LVIKIDGKKKEYDISDIGKKEKFKVGRSLYYVNVISNGYFREIEIRNVPYEEEVVTATQQLSNIIFSGLQRQEGMAINLDLKGIGISIVDEEPKEILYLSIYQILVSWINEKIRLEGGEIENQDEYNLLISHIQIDNMLSEENPIIFSPENALDKGRKVTMQDLEYSGKKKDEGYTPFIQVKFSISNTANNLLTQTKIDAIQVKIQTILLEVETGTLSVIVSLKCQI
jgi:hypothetical protein